MARSKEARKVSNAKYYERHKVAVKQKQQEYRSDNSGQEKDRHQKYRSENPERYRNYNARRRASIRNAPVNDFTLEQWLELLIEYGNSCAYCGVTNVSLSQDHFIPLSRGGGHTRSNILPACMPCNQSKNAMLIDTEVLK